MRRHTHPKRLMNRLLLALSLLAAYPLQAAGIQSLDAIREAARQQVASQFNRPGTDITIGTLDPRLRLSNCSQPLKTFFPQGKRGNKLTVGVRCEAPKRWTIYVTAEIHQTVEALVAKEYLRRGRVLGSEDLEPKRFDANQLKFGYFTDIHEVLGKTLKRHLNRGAVLTPSNIAVTKVIRRGERVSIIAETGGISVRASGEALEDGGLGDIIRVRNLNSRKVIEARIEAPGRVKVEF
jgi:flagella basal body P-ring formation protein FlgA